MTIKPELNNYVPIFRPHFAELIYADNSAICQNHSPSFQIKFAPNINVQEKKNHISKKRYISKSRTHELSISKCTSLQNCCLELQKLQDQQPKNLFQMCIQLQELFSRRTSETSLKSTRKKVQVILHRYKSFSTSLSGQSFYVAKI